MLDSGWLPSQEQVFHFYLIFYLCLLWKLTELVEHWDFSLAVFDKK